MRTFLQIVSVVFLVIGTAVGAYYFLNNLVLGETTLEAWMPVLVALPTITFSALIWVFVDIANRIAPLQKSSALEKLFPSRMPSKNPNAN